METPTITASPSHYIPRSGSRWTFCIRRYSLGHPTSVADRERRVELVGVKRQPGEYAPLLAYVLTRDVLEPWVRAISYSSITGQNRAEYCES